jgi:hypothetical protein
LHHPQLRPEKRDQEIRKYTKTQVDLVDLEENRFKTLPVTDVLKPDYPDLRYIASLDKGEYVQDIVSLGSLDKSDRFVLTFDYLTKDRNFVALMRTALTRLEKAYQTPVDIEFTLEIVPNYPYPGYKLHLLQCRPLSQRIDEDAIVIPEDIPQEDVLFRAHKLVPDGKAEGIRYIIFVDPEKYHQIPDLTIKLELGPAIGRLNKKLENESFILMGPGRWGSANIDLGVHVTYADIYNTKALIEVGVAQDGVTPELSYGTHFFQDLVESGIYSLPLHLDENDRDFNWSFFRDSPNGLTQLLPQDAELSPYLRLIDVAAVTNSCRLNILMDGSNDEAVGYLTDGDWPMEGEKGTVSTF